MLVVTDMLNCACCLPGVNMVNEPPPMDFFYELKKGSPLHNVRNNSADSFSIMPIDEGSDAVHRFQRVAHDAIAFANDEYTVIPHKRSRFGVKLYDMVVIQRASA
ncbi:hypothetical protein [Bradyrhizobium sp. DASA03120]|uniref:hypothetical protein n=1 Tax=Bradyrhizobium sp. SMVTL-02 TaxID=3395917 RepID=UPI003F6EA100